MESTLQNCRICKSSSLDVVVDLGHQVITSRFPDVGDTSTPRTRVRLVMCADCKLVQLKDTTHCSELYEHLYGYRSGLNEMMRRHLQDYNEELQEIAKVEDKDWVLDIGSNDATFLQYYQGGRKKNIKGVGCDPTGKQFASYYEGLPNVDLLVSYFTKDALVRAYGPNIKFRAISSISMFYDLPDPVQFARDVYDLLEDDGVWTLEQSYVATMLERNSIDTICHEHLEYYGVRQIKEIMDRAGFKIVKLGLNECNGGSFRIYVAKRGCEKHKEDVAGVQAFLEREALHGIHTRAAYEAFQIRCRDQANKLKQFLTWCALDEKKVYIYGASTKGNCLLQYAGVGPDLVPYAVERNPLKYGKMTSTGIPIVDEDTMRRDNPDYLLVLPWHFREGIVAREEAYLRGGGSLLFPFPHFELVSQKKRVLITGVDGQISRYLVPKLCEEYQIVGICRNAEHHTRNVLRIAHDLEEESVDWLESLYVTLRPDAIIHNASITNTEACENNPLGAMKLNGMVVGKLCQLIHTYGWPCKLFHASSSENYKKHGQYMVTDEEEEFAPQSMYGICKTFGHQLVDYYRKKYNLPFSNGILFTTESRYRKNNFLLRKVFHHAKAWKAGQKSVLPLGSLDSYRNIIHADDVAEAIVRILRQEVGGNYVICGEEIRKVEELVKRIYGFFGIVLEKEGTYYVDTASGNRERVLEIGAVLREGSSHINGMASRLKSLGWVPKYGVDDILRDVCTD